MLQKIINNKYYNQAALRITLIYMVLSALWILFSDKLLLTNPETTVYISTGKGWFYTIVVGIFFYLTMSRELNNLQRAESDIDKYQKLLEASLESQKETILLSIDKNYNYLYFNKAHAQSMRQSYDLEPKLGMSILDCISSESDKLVAKKNYDRALAGESHHNIHVYGDKNKIYYESFFNPILNDKNEIIGATALARDVTEAQKLKEKNAWLASFPLLNPSPVLEINKNCEIIFINQISKDLFPGIESSCATHPFLAGATSFFDILDIIKNKNLQRELEIDGKWYLQTLFLVSQNSLRVYATDITARKLGEIKLKELDKLKDSFLIITTHELKTPLIPIKSQAQLLLAGNYGELNPEQRKAIDMILRNEEHINRLTSDVMDQAKISSKNLKIELTETDVNEVINEVINDVHVLAKEKNIQISVLLLPNVLKIKLDKERIEQVLNNILNNAIKFTPNDGKVSLELTADQSNINFIIKDTGIGMSSDNLKKLFSPFFQIDCELNRKYRGTGLGLAIAKGIIEAHGGHISAESAGENQGSTFSFNLPIN